VELYLHSPNAPSWRGAQVETTLPLPFSTSMLYAWHGRSAQSTRFTVNCVAFQRVLTRIILCTQSQCVLRNTRTQVTYLPDTFLLRTDRNV
jgi:hypothetical protein